MKMANVSQTKLKSKKVPAIVTLPHATKLLCCLMTLHKFWQLKQLDFYHWFTLMHLAITQKSF